MSATGGWFFTFPGAGKQLTFKSPNFGDFCLETSAEFQSPTPPPNSSTYSQASAPNCPKTLTAKPTFSLAPTSSTSTAAHAANSTIGQAKRRLAVRAGEHGKEGSNVSDHLAECGQAFDRTKFEIAASNLKGRQAREKYESLLIKDLYRKGLAMNTCETSRHLTIFN